MGHWTDFQPILGRDIRAKEGVVPFVLNKPVASKILIDKITGASYQKQLSGKNLYDVNSATTVNYEPTVDSDGWVTFEYDNSAGTGAVWGNYFTPVSDKLQPSTRYLIVTEIKEFTNMGGVNVFNNTANDTSQFEGSLILTNTGIHLHAQYSKSSFDGVDLFLRTFVTFPAGKKGKVVFRISVIEYDASVTADNFQYEPYCGGQPSPNPGYSQEIVSLGDSGTLLLTTRGKNLLDITLDSATKNGLEFKIDKKAGTVTVDGTATATTYFPIRTYYPWELGTYMLTGCPGKQSNATYNLAAYVGTAWNPEYGSGRIITISKTKNVEYIDRIEIVVQKGQTLNNVVFKPMLRKCDSNGNPIGDDEFAPYIEGYSVEVPVYEPLRAINDVRDEICMRDGKYGVLRRIIEIVLNGDENYNLYCSTEGYFYIHIPSNPPFKPAITDPLNVCCISDQYVGIYRSKMRGLDVSENAISAYTNEIAIRDLTCNTCDEFIARLAEKPVTVQYVLAEPVFEPFEDQSPFYEFGVLDGFTQFDISGENPNLEPATVGVSYPVNSDGVYVMDAYICGKKNEIEASKVATDKTVVHAVHRTLRVELDQDIATGVNVLQYLPENAILIDVILVGKVDGITTYVGSDGMLYVTSDSVRIINLNMNILYTIS